MRLILPLTLVVLMMPVPQYAQDVHADYDRNADFKHIKTFAVKIGTSWHNQISEKRVQNEIEQALEEKGWVPVEPDKADALVVLHGATEKQKTLNTFYSGGYGGYGWRGWGAGGGGTATTSTSEFLAGTLVVDIFDTKNKQLMYRGTVADEISDKPEKNQKKLAKASDKLFHDLPATGDGGGACYPPECKCHNGTCQTTCCKS